MKKLLSGSFLAILFIAVIIASGCKKTPEKAPELATVGTTAVITELTSTSAVIGGIILAPDPITGNGICWSSTHAEPNITEDTKIAGDSLTLRFTGKMTGLTPSTQYYVRAFATSRAGTAYGGVIKFTTPSATSTTTVTVSTLAGSPGGAFGYANGTGNDVLFNGPRTINYSAYTGLINVSDVYNNAIRTLTTGGVSATLTDTNRLYVNGPLAIARFYGASSTATDGAGNIYVADAGNNCIRKITPAGEVSTFAGSATGQSGFANSDVPANARFNNPQSVVVDAGGNVYVADMGNNRIRKISSAGTVTTFAGDGTPDFFDSDDGNLAAFNQPFAIAIAPTGDIYVADQKNRAIRKITSTLGSVSTVAGGTDYPDQIGVPAGIAIDAQSNIYIADQGGRILRLTNQRALNTLAGAFNTPGFVNGNGAAARFKSPQGLTFDAAGNLYVADFGNNVVRKVAITITP